MRYSTIQKIESAKCEKRTEASIAFRKEKVEKSKFKKLARWFYFGNGWDKDENGKRYFNYTKEWYPPYKTFLWKRLWKWQKKMEKKGVVIKRPYSYEGKETYTLYKHQKHISLTLKGKIKDFFNSLGYRPSICVFDFYDVENYWITKLTVMGVSMYLTGNTTTAKYHAHEMWVARKMLLDGIGYEDKKQYEFEQFFEKTYGVKFELTFMPSDKESYIKYKNAIPDAIVSITPIKPAEEYVKKTLPELEDEVFRKEAYRVALEMDKFYSENYLNSKNTIAIAKEQKRLTTAAFKYIGEHYTGWWD